MDDDPRTEDAAVDEASLENDSDPEQQQGPSLRTRMSIILIGASFLSLIFCMCLFVLLVAV